MKVFVALLALIALASANLQNDLEDLGKLVPHEEITALGKEYLTDKEFLKFLFYFKSKDFRDLWVDVLNQKDVHVLVDYCEAHDVPAVEEINKLADALGLPHYPKTLMQLNFISERKTGGVAGFFKDVDALIPYPALKKAIDAKYQESADFKGFFDLIHVDHFEKFVKENKNAQKFVNQLKKYNVDYKTYWNHVKDLLQH